MSKLYVITTPQIFPNEAQLLTCLFEEGMRRLHLRKPGCEREEICKLLDEIPSIYRDRIVLHDWLDVAVELKLGGVHLNRRNAIAPAHFNGRISRSCHSLKEVAMYKPSCDYVFLSPIFQSISKEGYGSGFQLEELRAATEIDEKVIALGGICERTIAQLKGLPFGGVAVLGALWGNNPASLKRDELIKQYKKLNIWP